jgi:acetylornithine deacetylase/succinyl-diaminopimelate desuccinylase-like protein
MQAALEREAVGVLQGLLRFNTANPPGAEREAQEHLGELLREAGLEVELAGDDPARPNVVARLRGREDGPALGLLSHMDTVTADPEGWRHDPWSGELDEGCVWGRGALDMKSQVAAEAVAACSLARAGWRPARGDLLVICVSDEEEGGTGAEWLTSERPDLCRCDWLLNEGAGASFALDGGRAYDVSVGEKGVFRFTLATEGVAGHAATPHLADNALPKLAPLLEALGADTGWDVTPGGRALLDAVGLDVDSDPRPALAALAERAPELAPIVEPTLRMTLAPTMVEASAQMNVIPERAVLHVDCRVPPGMEQPAVTERLRRVLGDNAYKLTFTECVVGTSSPPESPLMDAIGRWVERADPGARCLPTLATGYSDSNTFRAAFPGCVAYGFFPHRHMSFGDVARLPHARDERIDVRDLAQAVDCYRAVAVDLLGEG